MARTFSLSRMLSIRRYGLMTLTTKESKLDACAVALLGELIIMLAYLRNMVKKTELVKIIQHHL